MHPRQKKLILVLSAVPFLVLYAGLALTIYDLMPKQKILELVYFFVAGTAWAFPLKPVMKWANSPIDG